MKLLSELIQSVYTNFFSFDMILCTAFTFLVGLFLITLPGKSKSTIQLAMVFLPLSLFNLSYIYSTLIYHPAAAFHRWGTVLLIFPTILHFVQWIFYYPEDTHPKIRRIFLAVQYFLGLSTFAVFAATTYNAPKKFHFTGHYWDFDAENISKFVGILIFAYGILVIPVAIWKFIELKGRKERWVVLKMSGGILVSTLVPAFTNVLSRDGIMDRGTFMVLFATMTILGFFYVVLVYFNSTQDKTTFMGKIVGISLVSFLLMMQGLSFVTMKDRENDYDTLRLENAGRALEGGEKNQDIQYILKIKPESNSLLTEFDTSKVEHLDLPLVKVDLLNTVIYEKINMIPEENFKAAVTEYLKSTHPEFNSYRLSIEHFMEAYAEKPRTTLKKETLHFMDSLNKASFIHSNKLGSIPEKHFCEEAKVYISKIKDQEKFFRDPLLQNMHGCRWKETELDAAGFRKELYKYFRFFKPAGHRQYRKSLDGYAHYTVFTKYDPKKGEISEVGFSYQEYRKFMHESAEDQVMVLFAVLFILLAVYPYFFQGSLITPLNSLLSGVKKVNAGDLDVAVDVKVNDEIGFLTGSFNSMVDSIRDARLRLEDYAQNLEHKVQERTKEVQEKMEEVQKLKIQQDGDYFLTSLLAKPLFFNANKSEYVKTEFIVNQKKQFQFRNKIGDLGGDICITGNLKFGIPADHRRYTMVMNGDAMGKSMQGAGGSLVMGVVMNSIMARSASNKRVLDMSPEKWLTDVYNEIHSVFKTFNGTMVISATVALIDDLTGRMLYWNAEHPFSVLYRDMNASFIETGLNLRKLGLESEYEFQIFEFQMEKDDVIILASDGRDDIDLTPHEDVRTINDDEMLFLKIVEEGKGEINDIVHVLKSRGEITDDLSILKVTYIGAPQVQEKTNGHYSAEYLTQKRDLVKKINGLYAEGRDLYYSGRVPAAKEKIQEAYGMSTEFPKLNRLYALLCYKTKDYMTALNLINGVLQQYPNDAEMWHYLSRTHRKLGSIQIALECAERAERLKPGTVQNILHMARLYRTQGNSEKTKEFAEKVLELDFENKSARKILSML
ncbi:MAG TPA: SpoIIE family protein phosphatase [Leptospiraceae bacterium]|nr:SpoIIE family protein phosphatase [Leptospiraceae bacterium]HMY65101.1 SpoIIE family protein phosphatase [Leptospiraceae bacterium]HNF24199.1 SpoIIE family protein phosphatase [Leptospiraceae bacterium]HNM01639.1 SpoIIE family protein phosphatase [Leptospiraceae bacterium]HNN02503.1 SpoIIE family protein phosphatase [Leptospiraceae bacterium]